MAGPLVDPKERTPLLGGPTRYLTFISTDKPLYRPGERVLVRGLVLEALSRKPHKSSVPMQVKLDVRGPREAMYFSGVVTLQDAVWSFVWNVPSSAVGGEYTLEATYSLASGDAPARRTFAVRAYRAPRLKSQIEFLRDGYGPGDTVTATLDVKRAEGGVPAGAQVTATALVDGATVAQVQGTVTEQGLCTVRFPLPAAIERGEGSLAFSIRDGGVVESAARTLPILLRTLDLSFHPEGGDLVAGLPSRVYFQARTPARKPADLVGAILDTATGEVVTAVRSEHEGRGRFELTPRPGAVYALRIDEPSGIQRTFALPEVRSRGAVLRAAHDVVPPGEPVTLSAAFVDVAGASVTLSQREVEVASAELGAGGQVTLDPGAADGVLIATVWDRAGQPLAERLVFRQPARALEVSVKADREHYVPGDTVTLTVRTAREGKPVPAWVMLTVTDEAVLELIEKRDQAPSLPVMVLLEPEVRELADAHVYLDPKHPKARLAVDLLLGTQGWRRFALADPKRFIEEHGDAALRALAVRKPVPPPKPYPVPMLMGRPLVPIGRVTLPPPGTLPPSPPPSLATVEPSAPLPPAMQQPAPSSPPLAPPAPPLLRSGPIPRPPVTPMTRALPTAPQAPPPIQVHIREYAHKLRPGRVPGARVDFAETLYWNAGARTHRDTGELQVSFTLNDSVTTFQASAGAVGKDGALGSAVAALQAVQPFYAEPKLPLEVTAGDVLQLPVALVNGTSSVLEGAGVRLGLVGEGEVAEATGGALAAGERSRHLLELRIGQESRPARLALEASAGGYVDTVTRPLSIQPSGFPLQAAFSGLVSAEAPAVHTVALPGDVVGGSVRASLMVYPSLMANMTEAMARLIRDPSGCFEQTSSTTYPMTMALRYLQGRDGVAPALVASARKKLEAGYKRLVGFECAQGGFEWYGKDPGHEALTAYGLLHLHDLRQVRGVDPGLLERTRAWLMRARDGKGRFERRRRSSFGWTERQETSDAYILWALLESTPHPAGLALEVGALQETVAKSENSYVVALAANVLGLAGEGAAARGLMDRLAGLQTASGLVKGGTESIVGSWGESLSIETTALALLAWLRGPGFEANVERAVRFLAQRCEGGRYGTTQSTVLALRALLTYGEGRATQRAPGAVRVFLDGEPVGGPVRFDPSTEEVLPLPDLSGGLTPGEHQVELRMEGGWELPYAFEATYHALVPASAEAARVGLEVALAHTALTEGEPTEARVTVLNRTDLPLPMTVALIGVPGGLEVRHAQLQELVKQEVVDAYEVRGRDVVLYWRTLGARQRREVPLSLLAAVPGTYTGPASRAYLYYADADKVWHEGLKVSITPRR